MGLNWAAIGNFGDAVSGADLPDWVAELLQKVTQRGRGNIASVLQEGLELRRVSSEIQSVESQMLYSFGLSENI